MTARDTIALKPCPFCGNRNVAQGASGGYISVWCFCGARGPDVPFPENCDPLPPIKECHAAWNRRAEPAASLNMPVPAGFVLVPEEPTKEMLMALFHSGYVGMERYRAMLSARPKGGA